MVAEGVLGITQPASLGTTLTGTALLPGGRLGVQIPAGLLDEPLTLNGDADKRTGISAIQSVAWTGPITLQGTGAPYINAADNAVVSIAGTIGGSQGVQLRRRGDGHAQRPGLEHVRRNHVGLVRHAAAPQDRQHRRAERPGDWRAAPGGQAKRRRCRQPDQIQGSVSVMHEGVLDLNGRNDTIGALTLPGGVVKTGAGVLTLGGDVTALESPTLSQITGKLSLGAQTRTLDVRLGAVLYIPAVISAPLAQGIVKRGLGNLQLAGANNYTGPTTVERGAVIAAIHWRSAVRRGARASWRLAASN